MRYDVNPVHRASVQHQKEPVFPDAKTNLAPWKLWCGTKYLLFNDLRKMSQTPKILLVSLYRAIDHTCVPCDDVGDSKQPRNAGHSLRLHTHMLNGWSAVNQQRDNRTVLRFSPVWLYMCVCNELGRVKRLSQILHLCFFCVLEEILELNCPIIEDGGAGGTLPFISPVGGGSVRELIGSNESDCEP